MARAGVMRPGIFSAGSAADAGEDGRPASGNERAGGLYRCYLKNRRCPAGFSTEPRPTAGSLGQSR